MADSQPFQLLSKPGIKRDGTRLEGDNCVDGQWVRWQRGLPRKIGGYHSINKYLREASTFLHEYTHDQLTYIHSGSPNHIERFFIQGVTSSVITDRTPTSGFTASDANLWQFDVAIEFSAGVANALLVAQVAPNLNCICNGDGGELFAGNLFDTTVLTPITLPAGGSATGGIITLGPYLVFLGNDGYFGWSVAKAPTNLTGAGSGQASIATQKLVRGMHLRGGPGASPSGLIWSADALVRATFVGGSEVWQFDTLADDISILSPRSVIEYDGIYYWWGVDRCLAFNGVVQEVPNDLNINYFLDGLNFEQRMKVFATKVPRYGEIWWCYPRGDATECTHAIIYNVREKSWYDTELPNGGRAAGLPPAVYTRPVMAGSTPNADAQAYDLTITAAGTGYTAGDVLTVVGGGDARIATEITVNTVGGGGAITGASITNQGAYGTAPTNPVSVTGGTGASATFTLTYVNPYKFWVHELGVDEVDGQSLNPVRSYFETADITLPLAPQPQDKALQIDVMEPDFVQTGEMQVVLTGRANARSKEVTSATRIIVDPNDIVDADQQITFFQEQRRQMRFRFTSDIVGGDYQMGAIILHVRPTDGTKVGALEDTTE